jgi:hypothetical protein
LPRADAAVRRERDTWALRLFLSGHSYREIGKHPKVNLSAKGVGNVIHQQLAQARPNDTTLSELACQVHIERLEALLRAAWPQAIQGDLKAIMTVSRVLHQEAIVLGVV